MTLRRAEPGEVIVPVIAVQGNSRKPGRLPGDVPQPLPGDEKILVAAAKFAERYEGPIGPAAAAG